MILFSSLLLFSELIRNQTEIAKEMEVMSLTAPSSPRHFSGCFLSAPTSPRRFTELYKDFDQTATRTFSDRLTIPFDWEETPGTPRTITNDEEDDFAFEIGQKFETTSLFAEELFDGGKIKPLKPPPYLQFDHHHQNKTLEASSVFSPPISSPRSSPIAHGKNIIRKAFSPRKKPVDVDPFEVAIDNARKGVGEERGRERRQNSSRRAARSLSPFRVSAYPWEELEQEQREVQEQRKGSTSTCVSCKSSSSKKWRLKDFLLFRSVSEGRARHNKDSVKTFSGLFRKQEDTKDSSSRGRGSSSSSSSSISAHGVHYMAKKAETKDLKKRTFLPYMQIGRFAF